LRFIYFAYFTPASRDQNVEKANRTRVNSEITAQELRVVDEDGKMIGLLSRNEALRLAEEREMDLVEIAPQAIPPVCKIIDFGKFSYEQHKREKQQRKHQQLQQMKEIRFKWRTDIHDFNFKTRHAREFILAGNKVKATVMFRGREIIHQEIGMELLERFVTALDDIAKVDQKIKSEGKFLSIVLTLDKTKKKK